MIRLSIIIPVFNVEEFIGECISSCLRQDIPGDEYEIILVDDCSPDQSIAVARKVYLDFTSSNKPELKIISSFDLSSTQSCIIRKNHGLSVARNSGLREARGEYVWFVDSDDMIETNCLAQLMNCIIRDNLDILRFGYKFLFENGQTEEHLCENTKIMSGKELYAKWPHPVGAWSFIFKRVFLLANSLIFINGYLFEDQEFSPRAHWFASKARRISVTPYLYRQRRGSIMKSNVSQLKVKSALAVCESLYNFNEIHEDSLMSPVLSHQIAFMFSNAINLNSQCGEPISLEAFKQCHCYPLKGVSGWKYRLINFSLHLSSLVCKIKHYLHR